MTIADSTLARSLAIIKALDPVRLAQVLLDFTAVVHSQIWDGRRTGPDFVVPMASLSKRQSGHLARLIIQHSKHLPNFKHGRTSPQDRTCATAEADPVRSLHCAKVDAFPERQEVRSQAVAILDMDDLPHRRLESQYTTSADVDLMILVPILLSLLVILRTRESFPAVEFIIIDIIAALILGPGTLTLTRRTAIHPTELDTGPGCAVLMEDDFTVVIRGKQRIVEAITEGGFFLSLSTPKRMQGAHVAEIEQEKQVISDILYGTLEGGCRGVCEAILMRFLHMNFTIPNLKEIAYVVVFGRMIVKACWYGLQASYDGSLPPVAGITPLRSAARLTGEFLGLLIVAACIASTSATTILLHGASFFVQSFYFGLFARLIMRSQNYHIRTERFLEAMGHPPIRKWAFRTRASAATFVCFLLCRGIPRPVRSIHILGVLDTLIPNQRDIWRVWKERVADRIVNEDYVAFTPTIPTFPDWRQRRLKRLLDEAQLASDEFRHSYS